MYFKNSISNWLSWPSGIKHGLRQVNQSCTSRLSENCRISVRRLPFILPLSEQYQEQGICLSLTVVNMMKMIFHAIIAVGSNFIEFTNQLNNVLSVNECSDIYHPWLHHIVEAAFHHQGCPKIPTLLV